MSSTITGTVGSRRTFPDPGDNQSTRTDPHPRPQASPVQLGLRGR
jgi:hypothetical protein